MRKNGWWSLSKIERYNYSLCLWQWYGMINSAGNQRTVHRTLRVGYPAAGFTHSKLPWPIFSSDCHTKPRRYFFHWRCNFILDVFCTLALNVTLRTESYRFLHGYYSNLWMVFSYVQCFVNLNGVERLVELLNASHRYGPGAEYLAVPILSCLRALMNSSVWTHLNYWR